MIKESRPEQPLSPHRQRKYDSMVHTILDQARAIMREHGVAALSMQELARRMEMRPPSLYHYFNSKMEIYDALFQLGFTLFGEHMEGNSRPFPTWQEYVAYSFEGYLSFAKQNPELYQLCFERPVPGFVPSEESLQISLQLLNQFYQNSVEISNTIRTDLPARQMVDLLISMMHGITAMHMANEPDLPAGEGRFGSLIPAALAVLDQAWSRS